THTTLPATAALLNGSSSDWSSPCATDLGPPSGSTTSTNLVIGQERSDGRVPDKARGTRVGRASTAGSDGAQDAVRGRRRRAHDRHAYRWRRAPLDPEGWRAGCRGRRGLQPAAYRRAQAIRT